MNVAVLNKTAKAIILLILTRQEPHSEKSNCPRHRFELVARIQRPRCGNLPSVFGGEPELRHQPLGDSTKVSPAGGSRSCVAPTLEGGVPKSRNLLSPKTSPEEAPRRCKILVIFGSGYRLRATSSAEVPPSRGPNTKVCHDQKVFGREGVPEVAETFVAEDVPRRSPPKMQNPSHF